MMVNKTITTLIYICFLLSIFLSKSNAMELDSNGIRDLEWGIKLSDLKDNEIFRFTGINLVGLKSYKRITDDLTVGKVGVKSITYDFCNEAFSQVSIKFYGGTKWIDLKDYIHKYFGEVKKRYHNLESYGMEKIIWENDNGVAELLYSMRSQIGFLMIRSLEFDHLSQNIMNNMTQSDINIVSYYMLTGESQLSEDKNKLIKLCDHES